MKGTETIEMPKAWMSLDEAATYIGIGKTVLYSLARESRIPASKVGKKWTFDPAQLDLWVQGNRPMEVFFSSLDYRIEENASLRDPQREGYMRTFEFFRS